MPALREITLQTAIRTAQYLRIADCLVRPERRSHFIEMQKTVWQTGMAASMLAGAFWQDNSRFLVTTLWASKAAHQEYIDTQFPLLQKLACPENDLSAGVHLPLVPKWTVIAKSEGAAIK